MDCALPIVSAALIALAYGSEESAPCPYERVALPGLARNYWSLVRVRQKRSAKHRLVRSYDSESVAHACPRAGSACTAA
jgi:hypothetical protein